MKEFLEALHNSELFRGISDDSIMEILNCSGSSMHSYSQGEIIKSESQIENIGVVLSGSLHIINEDYWGNKFILREVREGQIFGAEYAIVKYAPKTFTVIAQKDTNVLYINTECVVNMCEKACEYHRRMVRNLLSIVSEENIDYQHKFEHMSKRSTREKLLSYFSEQAERNNSAAFEISFNRQQMADYLSVDRSAMCSELSKMQKEGMISYHLNHFELKKQGFPINK